MQKALLINPGDNVAVALEDVPAGGSVLIVGYYGKSVVALRPIPFGHKMAITSIERGKPILKYDVPIAFATRNISTGEWVHEHNAKSYFVAKREGGAR